MEKFETDSRNIKKGDTYVCIKGLTNDGHDFINEAIKNGATQIIGSNDINCSVPYIKVKDPKKYVEDIMIKEIPENVKITGITGTNGKTTTSLLTNQLLIENGFNSAYLGTNGFLINNELIETKNTTPTLIELINILKICKENSVSNLIMEISSIALMEERLKKIFLDSAAFTNLTQDHLDYHKNMENYLNAKLKILEHLRGNIILNKENPYSKFFIKNPIYYGKENSDLIIKNIKLNINYSLIDFLYKNKLYNSKINLIGSFNIENYLHSILLADLYIKDMDKIIKASPGLKPPKGRFEKVAENIIVDYAHTPDAVEKIINTCNNLKEGRIITVIGCGGNRDKSKRNIMGKIATQKSDYVIFTNDNPRNEDPKEIMNDITQNLSNNFEVIFDREEAIKKAIKIKNTNDIVLILGKGHEDYQIIGNDKFYFDDAEVAKIYIKK